MVIAFFNKGSLAWVCVSASGQIPHSHTSNQDKFIIQGQAVPSRHVATLYNSYMCMTGGTSFSIFVFCKHVLMWILSSDWTICCSIMLYKSSCKILELLVLMVGPQMVYWSRWRTWHMVSFDYFRSQLHREGRSICVVCLIANFGRWQVLIESLHFPVMLPVLAVYCYPCYVLSVLNCW